MAALFTFVGYDAVMIPSPGHAILIYKLDSSKGAMMPACHGVRILLRNNLKLQIFNQSLASSFLQNLCQG
jgi:hypothetical protein